MFTLNSIAIIALAGTTIAAPALQERDGWSGSWGGWKGGWSHGSAASTSTVWDIATATVTMTGVAPTWTYTPPESTPEASAAPSTTAEAVTTPAASPAAFYTAWSSEAAPAASTATSSAWAASSAAPSTGTYMDVVDQWRAAGGLPALTEDSTLQGNALKTVEDSKGQMVHELNPGSMAQVLAPGNANNFESVYVGGWLCEIPSLPGLNGICTTMAVGWDHSDGETGHADILTSTSYTKIGCALFDGIWACDLA